MEAIMRLLNYFILAWTLHNICLRMHNSNNLPKQPIASVYRHSRQLHSVASVKISSITLAEKGYENSLLCCLCKSIYCTTNFYPPSSYIRTKRNSMKTTKTFKKRISRWRGIECVNARLEWWLLCMRFAVFLTRGVTVTDSQ